MFHAASYLQGVVQYCSFVSAARSGRGIDRRRRVVESFAAQIVAKIAELGVFHDNEQGAL